MGYKVVSPSGSNCFFNVNGTAISGAQGSQPTVNTGRAVRVGTGTLLSNVDPGFWTSLYGAQLTTAVDGVNVARNGSTVVALQTAGQYVIVRGGDRANYLQGIASTTLRSGASNMGTRKAVKGRNVITGPLTATAIRAGYWKIANGAWSTSPTASTAGYYTAAGAAADITTDSPSRSAPGELVYKTGKPIPVMADYDAKTG